ncbi:RNA polymerase sigma factor [Streptomyces specialis]|uniref:RNA polymerase sigma factor n=1 Tax=Streptomyces specialis TaxID=498367 RepID=UPI00073E1D02|nr:sigma-70 family RNA polymerase sigma factor [Streptomyces specialis]
MSTGDRPGEDPSRHRGDRPAHVPVDLPLDLPLDGEAFYIIHQELYHDYAETYLGDRRTAEEVVHRAFLEILSDWDEFLLAENTDQRAWSVVRRHVEQQLVDEGRPAAFVVNGEVQQVLRATQDKFRYLHGNRGLYEAMAELPPRQFDVLVLRYVVGYETRRIAWFMGLDERTVAYHGRRGKARLRARLGMPPERSRRIEGKEHD